MLVTGQLVRLHLRRELARHGVAHTNVHFFTLTEYARHVANATLRGKLPVVLPTAVRELLLKRVLEEVRPQLTYFGDACMTPGFRRALAQTLDDLRHAMLSPDRLRAAAERIDPKLRFALAKKLLDISVIWTRMNRLREGLNFADEIRLLGIAANSREVEPVPLILYGFDALSELERAVLDTPLRQFGVSAFIPTGANEAATWTAPLVQWLSRFDPEVVTPVSPLNRPPAGLKKVRQGLFKSPSNEAQPADDKDTGIRVISAPTPVREAEELVRDLVLTAVGATGKSRSGILLRDERTYTDLIRDGLAECDIQGYFHRCRTLADTPSGQAARALCALLDGRFRRKDVTEFISLSGSNDAADWNTWSLLAGVRESREQWQTRLMRLARRFGAESGPDDDADSSAKRADSVARLRQYLERLFDGVQRICAARRWTALRDEFLACLRDVPEPLQELSDLETELEAATLLDSLGVPPTLADFRSLVESALRRPIAREGHFQKDEPTVSGISSALGVVFDDLYLPGMVEKGFPRPADQDPLLTDSDRIRLQELTKCGRLDTRKNQMERERFLFSALIGSARRSVHLSFPRLDALTRQERIPSSFLLRTVEALDGRSYDYRSLDNWLRSFPASRFVSVHPLQTADGPMIQRFQARLQRIARAIEQRDARYLFVEGAHSEGLLRGAQMEWSRFGSREFTPFDGVMCDTRSQQSIRHLNNSMPSHSVTAFQRYATCPFQYFAENVLRLSALEEPDHAYGLAPPDKGSLLHKILERFYVREHDAHLLPLTEAALPRLMDIAKRAVAEFEREQIPPPPAAWKIMQQRFMSDLEHWFRTELRDESGFVPQWFEQEFGREVGNRVEITLDDGQSVHFHGRIDRMDSRAQTHVRVVDYKSGAKAGNKYNHSKVCGLDEGRLLQAPVYFRAAELLARRPVAQVEYHFFDAGNKQTVYTAENNQASVPILLAQVRRIHDGICSGDFHPTPGEPCRHCHVKAACGAGRWSSKGGATASDAEDGDE